MNEREQLQANLAEIIRQSASGNNAVENLLSKHIEEIEIDDALQQPELLEQLRILLDKQGDITVATSQKLPNLKFKLGDMLLEAAGGVLGSIVAIDKPDLGCPNWLLSVDRFLDSRCQSRLSSAW